MELQGLDLLSSVGRPLSVHLSKNKKPVILTDPLFGGATGTRTLDLFHAMEAL